MLDANPNLTVQQVRDILQSTAVPWGPEGKDVDYGWGRLDGYAAVKRAAGGSGGSGPAMPGHLYFEGNLASQGAKGEHSFSVNDVSYPVCVTLIMPNWSGSNNPDFDLYVFNPDGSELGRATGSNRQEQVTKRVTQTGTYKVEVRSYAGSGAYFVDVSAGAGQSTDQPPTVAFDQPAEGATVSGTVTVKVRATDDTGVSKVELAVDGGAYADMTRQADGTYARDWDTSGAANGAHTLTARATDSASQTATASRQVTVSNQTEPPPEGAQTITRTGRVTTAGRDWTTEINVGAAGFVDFSLAWSTRADLDFYVYAPDGTLAGRAYTLSNPEKLRVDTVRYGTGRYRVRVNLYSGPDSDFTLTAAGYKEEAVTGSVSSTQRDGNHEKAIAYTGAGKFTLSWSHRSDLDLFVYDPSGRERGRAYTLNNPEVLEVALDVTGTWRARVNFYSGAGGAYTLKMTTPAAILS